MGDKTINVAGRSSGYVGSNFKDAPPVDGRSTNCKFIYGHGLIVIYDLRTIVHSRL